MFLNLNPTWVKKHWQYLSTIRSVRRNYRSFYSIRSGMPGLPWINHAFTRTGLSLPLTGKSFFSVMPDCVNQVPGQLQPFSFKESRYDLIVLGYQAWFLSPSIPSNTLMFDPRFREIAKDTPVITITGARNMWLSAMEKIKPVLKTTGARLVGNIALVDRHHNFISFITIFHWMFKAKKDRYLNIFPIPGVSEADILNTKNYGTTAIPYLENANWQGFQEEMVKQGAVP